MGSAPFPSPECTDGLPDRPKNDSFENHFGPHSNWEARYFNDHWPQSRFEYQMDDLVVFGHIPEDIEGTWYHVHPDSHVQQLPGYPFVDGDGVISAFRFIKGQVSMKAKYVETERYLLERKAGRKLFGRYRNPYDNHPCLQLANDTTANTNVLYWAGDMLAISERGLPYAVDPDTLETRTYDPYGGQISARTFTAHPKIDPVNDSLVTFAITAKGLRSKDVVTYSVDTKGRIENEFWFKNEDGWAHDCWITDNWIIIANMPFTTNSDEEMKKPNADYWHFTPGRP
ncbi:carotenoid oxygenase [Aspergillus carlsbadensis]|nr:carotenoid oxygenase [Aspergillus carlsbadensis]